MNDRNTTDRSANCLEPALLTGYTLDDLSAAERAACEVHLERCPVCRTAADAERRIVSRLRNSPPQETPIDVTSAVLAQIPSDSWSHLKATASCPWHRRALRRAAALVLAIIGLGLLFALLQHGPRLSTDEAAMGAALSWLADQQQPTGLWAPEAWGGRAECTQAATGLALLALQRDPARYNQAIGSGVDALISAQAPDGCLSPASPSRMYDHAIGTLALLGQWNRGSPSRELHGAIDQALSFTRDQQHIDGGWGYRKTRGAAPNAALTLWHLQALAAADARDWPDTEGHLRRGLRWLRGHIGDDGRLRYQTAPSASGSPTLDAMGAACLAAVSGRFGELAPDLTRLTDAVLKHAPADSPTADYYRDFFRARALARRPEALAQLQSDLTAGQSQDAHLTGSWAPDDLWSRMGGRIYTTAMAALALDAS